MLIASSLVGGTAYKRERSRLCRGDRFNFCAYPTTSSPKMG
nr:hypothetical protein [Nostoc sp. EkiNYC01]